MMKKMKFSLIAIVGLIAFMIGSCQNNPTNPNNPNVQNIIDSLGIDTNNTNCQFNYTFAYDSSNNVYTFSGQGQGVAPIQYVWVIGQDTLYGQTVTVQGPVSDFCAAMLDADGCFTSICDSVAGGNGGNNNNCSTTFSSYVDTNNNMIVLNASGTGVAPFSYSWDIGGQTYTGAIITVPNNLGIACLTQTDANGCTATYCDSIGSAPVGGGCSVQAWAYVDSTGSNLVTASANATGNGPFTYTWFVDSTSYTGQTITWQGQVGTTYQACVTIMNNAGCAATDCATITVQ